MPLKAVHFSERVTVASLPVEEYKDAYHARRGPWGVAPNCDELWDGERRTFWERELTLDELKEIQRFRRLARYALVLQHSVGFIKVPMPKIPTVIEELVKIGNQERSKLRENEESSPRATTDTLKRVNQIALPPEEEFELDYSPVSGKKFPPPPSPAMETFQKGEPEVFSFENPSLDPHQVSDPSKVHPATSATLSESQRASIRSAAKVNKVDVVHRGRSKHKRMKKRITNHAVLQPWFALLYFFFPLFLLSSVYLIPFLFDLYQAWKHQRAIQAAIEVPYFVEQLFPRHPLLQSSVVIGFVAFEVTGVLYLAMLLVSQLIIFAIVRPLILSLQENYSDRTKL